MVLVAPLLLYIANSAWQQKPLPEVMAYVLLLLAITVFVYHAYQFWQKMQP